jgi:hypothetical protein
MTVTQIECGPVLDRWSPAYIALMPRDRLPGFTHYKPKAEP